MQKLIENFFADYDEFLEKGFEYIKEDYEKYSIFFLRASASPSPLEANPLLGELASLRREGIGLSD